MTKTFVVAKNDGLDAEFSGEMLGHVSSRTGGEEQTRWTELTLYKTITNKYVCHQVGKTTLPNEFDLNKMEVVTDVADVIAFFGTGWLSKKLYQMAGLHAHELIA